MKRLAHFSYRAVAVCWPCVSSLEGQVVFRASVPPQGEITKRFRDGEAHNGSINLPPGAIRRLVTAEWATTHSR
jgi:hypothetical protein